MSSELIHLHFGAGRLGLGFIGPWFQKPGSALYFFNRAVSEANPTGSTALEPARRNELLRDQPERLYYIRKPGEETGGETVHYNGFFAYDQDNLEAAVREIASKHAGKQVQVIVTASVLKVENYCSVLQALDVLCQLKEDQPDAFGGIYLVACENTLSALEVLAHESTTDFVTPLIRCHVTPVHALVDRMCVGLEEDATGPHPAVLVRAEDYGSLKLELGPETENLVALCEGSRVEFSRYVDTEKQIKSWQLNGTHWLIALHAFQNREDMLDFKLNEFITSSPENRQFTEDAMREMSEGISVLLHREPAYADFTREVAVQDYLDGAATTILRRFEMTDDPITRILARFQTPTSVEYNSIQSFSKRFGDRVNEPLDAYESKTGVVAPAAARSFLSFHHLIADGNFIDKVQPAPQAAAQVQ